MNMKVLIHKLTLKWLLFRKQVTLINTKMEKNILAKGPDTHLYSVALAISKTLIPVYDKFIIYFIF